MSAPASASPSAMPRPMPRDAPVTSATRPARFISAMSLSLVHQFIIDVVVAAAGGVAPFGRGLAVEDGALRIDDRDGRRPLDPKAEAFRNLGIPAEAADMRHADVGVDDFVTRADGGEAVGGDEVGEPGAVMAPAGAHHQEHPLAGLTGFGERLVDGGHRVP